MTNFVKVLNPKSRIPSGLVWRLLRKFDECGWKYMLTSKSLCWDSDLSHEKVEIQILVGDCSVYLRKVDGYFVVAPKKYVPKTEFFLATCLFIGRRYMLWDLTRVMAYPTCLDPMSGIRGWYYFGDVRSGIPRFWVCIGDLCSRDYDDKDQPIVVERWSDIKFADLWERMRRFYSDNLMRYVFALIEQCMNVDTESCLNPCPIGQPPARDFYESGKLSEKWVGRDAKGDWSVAVKAEMRRRDEGYEKRL